MSGCPGVGKIDLSPSVRDLGVTMCGTANFKLQIKEVIKKGNWQTSWILKTFRLREAEPMLVFFQSLVLPMLEYCCQL